MKLSSPTKIVFIISVILIIVGLLGKLVPGLPDVVNNNSFWITFVGSVLLTLGCVLKGF